VTRRLRPEERAAARAEPLAQVVREFIDSHAARGATPKTIAEVMNLLVTRTPEQIHETAPRPYGQIHSQPGRSWERLSGQKPVTVVEVRREIDRVRKSPGVFEKNRQESLATLKNRDLELAATEGALPPELRQFIPKKGDARKRHDLALARRFGASHDDLQRLADEMEIDVPGYLDF
jgi:hypothetical protein